MRYEAVLFDLDNTLLETGDCWARAMREAARKQTEVRLSDADIDSLRVRLLRDLLREHGCAEGTINRMRAARDKELLPLFSQRAAWCDGARELLSSLETERTAVVTASHAAAVDALDTVFQIRSLVRTIVTEDDTGLARQKPDPLGLFIACERLQADPRRCVYVGDQAYDLRAAEAAGMDAVLVRGKYTPPELSHETMIVSLHELPALL